MNVYVRELVSSLAQAGVECTTYTRASRPGLAEVVQVEPAIARHIPAGPYDLSKEQLPSVIDDFGDAVVDHIKNDSPADVLHANYWLSGLVGHRINTSSICPSSARSTRSPR
jgi:D-inositol-3-phosphate glycosyltransferase